MIGAIIGDVIGSVYENENQKTEAIQLFSRFSRFTDDTVLTVAIADAVLHRYVHPIALLENRSNRQLYAQKLKTYARRFPHAGYGQMFQQWAVQDNVRGYRSFGNGSALRVSPIGFAFDTLDEVLKQAKLSALVTHNHPEGIKGAQAVASAIFLARQGETKAYIRHFIGQRFHYDLSQSLEHIHLNYQFDSSCQGSVPQAIMAFLASDNFEDTVRKAISLGGDSDTIACIAGGIAQAYYQHIPEYLTARIQILVDSSLLQVVAHFNQKYNISS